MVLCILQTGHFQLCNSLKAELPYYYKLVFRTYLSHSPPQRQKTSKPLISWGFEAFTLAYARINSTMILSNCRMKLIQPHFSPVFDRLRGCKCLLKLPRGLHAVCKYREALPLLSSGLFDGTPRNDIAGHTLSRLQPPTNSRNNHFTIK